MIINDISHIEVATEEENNIQGGWAGASAGADAYASGYHVATASTYTSTNTSSGYSWWFGYYNNASAHSGSSSFSA